MFVDGNFECFTLEDEVREFGVQGEGKVWGSTAIPEGRYPVTIRYSNRFQKMMMAIEGVKYFTGILIHGGNTISDTHGCILVGDALVDNCKIKAGTSTYAVKRLFDKVNKALPEGVWITIQKAEVVS